MFGARSYVVWSERLTGGPAASAEPATPAAPQPRGALPTAPDADGFHAVAHEGDLADGSGRTVVVDNHGIALFHVNGHYHAMDDACTHEDAPLGEGEVDGHIVICPYHDWRYDLTTGACLTDPDRPVGCFATKVSGGFIWVGPRTSEGTIERGGDHNDGLKVTKPIR